MNPLAAAERYELDLRPAPLWKRWAFGAVALAWGLLAQDSKTYGGRIATVRDHVSGQVVGTFRERPIVDEGSDFAHMVRAHESKSADEFAAVWLKHEPIDTN